MSYLYKGAVASNNQHILNGTVIKDSYCALISCVNESDSGCGQRFYDYTNYEGNSTIFHHIKVQAKFDLTDNTSLLVMPSSLDTVLMPLSANLFHFTMDMVQEGK